MTKMIDIGRSGRTSSIAAAAALLFASVSQTTAQSGSVGGSIGKEDKSVSGSQAPARSLSAAGSAGATRQERKPFQFRRRRQWWW